MPVTNLQVRTTCSNQAPACPDPDAIRRHACRACSPMPSPPTAPVGADNTVTSRDLRIFVDQAAKPVTSPDAEVVVGRCDVSPADRWFLAEGPVRPAGVVVIDV